MYVYIYLPFGVSLTTRSRQQRPCYQILQRGADSLPPPPQTLFGPEQARACPCLTLSPVEEILFQRKPSGLNHDEKNNIINKGELSNSRMHKLDIN